MFTLLVASTSLSALAQKHPLALNHTLDKRVVYIDPLPMDRYAAVKLGPEDPGLQAIEAIIKSWRWTVPFKPDSFLIAEAKSMRAKFESRPTYRNVFPILCFQAYVKDIADKQFAGLGDIAVRIKLPATRTYIRVGVYAMPKFEEYAIPWKLIDRFLKEEPTDRRMKYAYCAGMGKLSQKDPRRIICVKIAEELLKTEKVRREFALQTAVGVHHGNNWPVKNAESGKLVVKYAKELIAHPQVRPSVRAMTKNLLKNFYGVKSPQ